MVKQNYKKAYVKTSDGVKLAINHFDSKREQVLIIANGWTMSKDSKFVKEMVLDFSSSFDVISFDFRGHGESSGTYTFTSKESQDLKAVVDWAEKSYKKIYLIGFSLGGAISVIYSSSSEKINRLIIVSAPHDFREIKTWMWIKDFLTNPFGKYETRIWKKLRPCPIIQKKIKPIDVVERIKAPTLFIVGDSDTIITPSDTKKLFEKANCEKQFKILTKCNHAEDFIHQEKEKFIDICKNWILAQPNIQNRLTLEKV